MKKDKILLLTDYFYPHWTGYAKSMQYLLSAVSEYYDITVLTVKHDDSLVDQEVYNSVKVIREKSIFTLSRSKYSLSILWKLFRILPQFDTVFINSPSVNILPFAVLTKFFGKKLLIFHQGDLILPEGFTNKIIEKIFDACTLLAFAFSDRVATYTRDYAEHSRVLKPYLNKFSPLIFPIPAALKQVHRPVNKRSINLGFSGRFVEEKGFDILFDAIPDIMRELPAANFIYAGQLQLSYENFFEKNRRKFTRVKKYITMLGLLEEKKMKQFYASLDFIIVPSRSDCFNLVQAEAALHGVPVVAADIPGLRVLVRETGYGMLFRAEDPEDLAERIAEAVKKSDSIQLKYRNVLSFLDAKKHVKAIRQFFEE